MVNMMRWRRDEGVEEERGEMGETLQSWVEAKKVISTPTYTSLRIF